MRGFIAGFLKFLFRFSFFKKRYFGIYKRIIQPTHLFRGVKKTVLFQNNILFELHIEDWIQQNIYFLGAYEPLELNFLKNALNEGNTVIDIGANIGVHALVAAKKVGKSGNVISFEPFPKNNELIQRNIELNDAINVQLVNFAITDSSKSITLFYNEAEENQGMASSFATVFSQSEKVEGTSLDDFLNAHPVDCIDLIKLDIEGGEYLALLGMEETLKRFTPTLLLELDDEIIKKTPHSKQQIIDFLKNLGYKMYYLGDNGQISEIERYPETKNFVFKQL